MILSSTHVAMATLAQHRRPKNFLSLGRRGAATVARVDKRI